MRVLLSEAMRRTLRQTMAIIACVPMLVLSACGQSGEQTSGSGGGDLHIGRTTVFDGFNLDQQLLNEDYAISAAVIEPLIRVGDAGKSLDPGIAQSWEYSSDNMELTIKLTPDVKFSDGNPLTAKDVAFSVDLWKQGPNYGSNYSAIDSTTVQDDETIILNLSTPDTSLPSFLAYSVAGVVPEDFGGMSEDDYWQKPIGAGAFTVDSWSTDGDVVLKKNPEYYREGYPKLDTVTNSFVSDVNSAGLQLRSKQIDAVNQLDTVVAKTLDQELIADVPAHQTPTLILNQSNPKLSDKSIRQAIGYALDYDALLETGFNGYGQVPDSSLPPNLAGSPKASNGYYHQDVAKAEELLAQAGGAPSEPLKLSYQSGSTEAAVQIIQENLKDIGIDVELEALDGGTWFGNLSEGTFEMSTFATNANSPDPIDPPTYVVGTKMLYSQGDTSKLAELIGEYNSSDDDGKATVIQEVDDYLTDEAPYIVLAATKVIVARQPTLKGLEVLPWSTYYYDTIEK